MPRFTIYDVEFDERNEHASLRATKEQIRSVLIGTVEAQHNKGSADYAVTGVAEDGTGWHIVFNHEDGVARPITAWPSKR